MKKITKFFSALLALLAVGLITVSLVACSSGDDSDSGSGNGGGSNVDYVAKYAYTEARDDYKGEKTFIFYKNGTFEYIDEMTLSGEHSYHEKETEAKGTYTLEEGDWENGKVKLTETDGDKASAYTGIFTIKDKVLTVDYKDFTATYTSKVEADSGKDNSDTKTELVAYKRNTTTSDGDPKTELLTFYSDKTFAFHETTADYDLDVCDGTYTGDPTKDGKVTATIKRMVSKSKMTKAFLEMGMAGVVTNEHAPLEACAEETMPCTISGNNLYDDEATPMTKVGASDSGSRTGNKDDANNNSSQYFGTKAPTEAKAVLDIVFSDGSATPYTKNLSLTDEQKKHAIAVIFYVGTDLNNAGDSASRTLGVGLVHNKTRNITWCKVEYGIPTPKGYDTNIETIQCEPVEVSDKTFTFKGDLNGKDNLSQMATFLGNDDDTSVPENYPALYFAKKYSEKTLSGETASRVAGTDYENGWFLPTVAEMYYILKNKTSVDNASSLCGGGKFSDGCYWTATQLKPGSYGEIKSYEKHCVHTFNAWDKDIYSDSKTGYNSVCAIREF